MSDTKGSAVGFGMTATVIMEVLCVAGVLFMIRFFVALFREGRPKSPSCVVYLSSWPTEQGVLHLASEPGARSARSDTGHPTRFQVIVGGTNPPVRRVG
jgi:hypothetical protein